MPTANDETAPVDVSTGDLLRLRMAAHRDANRLDGGWWPRSRDLAVELADLVDRFPDGFGRIVHAMVSPADWDRVPHVVPVAGGLVTVGSLGRGDVHQVDLTTSDDVVLRVLVVPPGLTDYQGAEALLAAATAGNAHSARDLLDEVTEFPAPDPMDRWTDGP